MKDSSKTTFLSVAFTHFVPCFFLGVISLYIVRAFLPELELRELVDSNLDLTDILFGTVNGLIVAGTVAIFHLLRNRRARSAALLPVKPVNTKVIQYGVLVGFLGGSFDIAFGLHNGGILVLTLMVLCILIWHLRIFAHDMTAMLRPGNHATWTEVAELLRIYMNMLAGFTLINATLEVAHLLAGRTPPFGFGSVEGELFINSLYYTVVTMTTLGYGDIVPKTWDAKLLLIFQCLASYVMFALMIGIITRGVVSSREKETSLTDK